METKKIDEITSIRYVGIEPSFKLYYEAVLCAFGWLGLHHLVLKDIKGFAIHYGVTFLSFVLMLIGSALFPILILGILVLAVFVVATWFVPILVAFYHYIDDDYFEAIKNKKNWPLVKRMALIVPEARTEVVQNDNLIL